MKTGGGNLACRIKVFQRCHSPGVHLDTSTAIMCRRNHGNGHLLNIDIKGQAFFIDHREPFLDIDVGVRRNIKIHIGISSSEHFLVHGSAHFISGSQISEWRIFLHKRNIILGLQFCAFSPHRFGDEETVSVFMEKGCWMKLNIFHIN